MCMLLSLPAILVVARVAGIPEVLVYGIVSQDVHVLEIETRMHSFGGGGKLI